MKRQKTNKRLLARKTAEAAAQWWVDRLDDQHADKREAFYNSLVPLVDEALINLAYLRLENDYDPQGVLLLAVREAGIECRGFMFSGDGIFPRKHVLTVKPGRLEPKEGYGNWTKNIKVTP